MQFVFLTMIMHGIMKAIDSRSIFVTLIMHVFITVMGLKRPNFMIVTEIIHWVITAVGLRRAHVEGLTDSRHP